ncbi:MULTISPECIES: glycosyltransferase family 4 protein [Providencia]|uniref:glycosyltransferase family 4 protein n=1 Tax=Providencia TaxID=586 RepID=UPI001F04D4EE|nr:MULTISPECIES: glycosyltransferase family 4 protein [Providencia]MCG9942716.1 glycosyltransferase family 4 protein [Providencia rettgeri]
MNIAILLPSLERKGPILVANDLVFELQKKIEVKNLIVFYFNDCPEPMNFPCETRKIKFIENIKFENFDIVHSHTLRTDLYLFLRKGIANRSNCKIVTTIHQYNYESFLFDLKKPIIAKTLSFLWNIILIRHDKIFVLSNDMKKYYSLTLYNKKIEVVYNGRPLPDKLVIKKITHIDNLKKTYKILGTACSLTTRKGLEQIIKALPSLKEFCFIVIGDGPEIQNLKNLAYNLNVKDRCFFEGFKKNYLDYYQYFDVFVLPSRSEGFGLALIEAASMKIPIVCSNIPSFNEIFESTDVVFFELDNITSIQKGINKAYITKEKLCNRSYYRYLTHYTSEVMAQNYLSSYKNLF